MALNTLAIDIGKHSFHLFGIDDDGVIVSRKVSRLKLVATVDRLDPKIIAMEACGSAHHWGRMFQAAGRIVRLINPYFVRPCKRLAEIISADVVLAARFRVLTSMPGVDVRQLGFAV